jgi:branched-chain amino acid transport system substrate-binding protein
MRATTLLVCAALCAPIAFAQPLRVGDINSYQDFPAHLEPYRKGWQLAEEELNRAGGVNGRRIEVLARDDGMREDEAVRHATDLVDNGKVDLLMGGFSTGVSLALADFAERRGIVYLATLSLTDRLAGAGANRYTFTLRPSAGTQASVLLPEAIRMKKKRWAIVYPHNMVDAAVIDALSMRLMNDDPGIDAVYDQVAPLGGMDAAGIALWMRDNGVQAVLSFLFGAELKQFVAAARAYGLLERLQVLNALAGQPEDLAALEAGAADGWWVTGYPADAIDYGSHPRFFEQYRARWGEPPAAGSLYGYTALMSIAHAVRRAKSTDAERLVHAFETLQAPSPVGPLEWRKDRRSTMGIFVGQLSITGKGASMVRWRYESAARHLALATEAESTARQE